MFSMTAVGNDRDMAVQSTELVLMRKENLRLVRGGPKCIPQALARSCCTRRCCRRASLSRQSGM
jgi:hypothetical protein